MKKLLLILFCLPMIGFGQFTYVPDDNFEQALINLGYDTFLDDNVTTASIDTITYLNIYNKSIADLTGIEAFVNLTELQCYSNQLTSLDVSSNTFLTVFNCSYNQLTTLNVSNNSSLTWLYCYNNQLTSLDVSSCILLEGIYSGDNQLSNLDLSTNYSLGDLVLNNNLLSNLDISANTSLQGLFLNNNLLSSLDISQNSSLYYFEISNNPFYCLNLANGNNLNFNDCTVQNTPYLYCIEVDDSSNVTGVNTPDSQTYYSNNCNNLCSTTEIFEIYQIKKLLKVTDLLGRETKQRNQPLFYIYDDGTLEKRIVIE